MQLGRLGNSEMPRRRYLEFGAAAKKNFVLQKN
jgi:hypothetical protein